MAERSKKARTPEAARQRAANQRRREAGLSKLQMWVPAARMAQARSVVKAIADGQNLPSPDDLSYIEKQLEIEKERRRQDVVNLKQKLAEMADSHENEMIVHREVARKDIKELKQEIDRRDLHIGGLISSLDSAKAEASSAKRINFLFFVLPWMIIVFFSGYWLIPLL